MRQKSVDIKSFTFNRQLSYRKAKEIEQTLSRKMADSLFGIQSEIVYDDGHQNKSRILPPSTIDGWIEEVWKVNRTKAIRRSLRWNETNIKNMNSVLSESSKFADSPETPVNSLTHLTSELKLADFHIFVSMSGSCSLDDPLFNDIMKMYSNLLKTFYVLFWKRKLRTKSYFKSTVSEFQDPFFRQMIRRKNLNDDFFNNYFFTNDFNIKEFIMLCLKKFIPHEFSHWANEDHEMHLYSLKLFLESFEYGFWTATEIDSLNEIVHTLILSMTLYEKFLAKKPFKEMPDKLKISRFASHKKTEKTPIESYFIILYEIKHIISEIYLHMILIILDSHVESVLPDFGIFVNPVFGEKIKPIRSLLTKDNLFNYSKIKNKLFFTYLGYSISTYFLNPIEIGKKVGESKMLDSVQKKLLGFLTDVAIDFYFHSIQTVTPNNLIFYCGADENEIIKKSKGYLVLLEFLVRFVNRERSDSAAIREAEAKRMNNFEKEMNLNYKDIRNAFELFRSGNYSIDDEVRYVGLVFREIADYLDLMKVNAKIYAGIQIAFSIDNIVQFLLLIIEVFMVFKHDEVHSNIPLKNKVIEMTRKGALLIADIIRENTVAISKLFEGATLIHLKDLAKIDAIAGAVLFSKIFLNDFGALIAETQHDLFLKMLKIQKYYIAKVSMYIKKNLIQNRDQMEIDDFVALLIYNRIFRALFKMKIGHSLKLEILYMDSIGKKMLYFLHFFVNRELNETKTEFFEQLNDQIRNTSSWATLNRINQDYLIEEAIYQGLCSFEYVIKRFNYESLYKMFSQFFTKEVKLKDYFLLLKSKRGQKVLKCIIKIYKTFMIFNRNTTFYCESILSKTRDLSNRMRTNEEFNFDFIQEIKALFEEIKDRAVNGLETKDAYLFLEIYYPICFKFASGFMVLTKDKNIEKLPSDVFKDLLIFINKQKIFLGKILKKGSNSESKLSPILKEFLQELSPKDNGIFSNSNYREKIKSLKDDCKEFIGMIIQCFKLYPIKCTEIELISETLLRQKSENIDNYISSKLKFHVKFRIQNNLKATDKPIDWNDIEVEFKKNYKKKGVFKEDNPKFEDENFNQSVKPGEKIHPIDLKNLFPSEINKMISERENNRLTSSIYHYGQFVNKKTRDKEFDWVLIFAYQNMPENEKTEQHILEETAIIRTSNNYSKKIIFFMEERYKSYKGFMLDNFEKNKVLYVINIQDSHTQNIKNVVSFFFAEFSKIDLDFKNTNKNFFVNNFYSFLLLFLDNMMQNASLFRDEIFAAIKRSETQIQKFNSKRQIGSTKKIPLKMANVHKSMYNLLTLKKILFSHLVNKNFIDDDWCGLYKPFYLISNFIQNLCENNFIDFKSWFNREDDLEHENSGEENENILKETNLLQEIVIEDDFQKKQIKKAHKQPISFLEDIYALTEEALLGNEVFLTTEGHLTAQDREEMFRIFARTIECITEFINGGKSNGANRLYYRRMDIFVGIFFRVIDDLDSVFYELKNNVIIYVSALIETPNEEKIEFIARNFSVIRIFNLVKELVKRLYLKQKAEKDPELFDLMKTAINEHKMKELIKKQKIKNWKVLVEYYKIHVDSFAEHKIIDICISLYVFMHNVGKCVSRYGHFVEELRKNTKNISQLTDHNNVVLYQKEPTLIWKFLMQITVEIEVEIESHEKISNKNNKKIHHEINEDKKLKNYIFKKKPICFFLNDKMRSEFLKTVKFKTLEEKRSDFTKMFSVYDKDCEQLNKQYIKNQILYVLNEYKMIRAYKHILFGITCALNILLLVFYNNVTQDYRMPGYGDGKKYIFWFSISGIILSSLCLSVWVINNYKYNVTREKRNIEKTQKKSKLSLWQIIQVYVIRSLLTNHNFVHFLFDLICYVLGNFVNPIFFCLAMFMIADISENILSMTNAFMKNWEKLMLGLILIVICINVFAYLLYDSYSFYFTTQTSYRFVCETYFKCILNIVNLGFIYDEGIAGVLTHLASPTNPQYIGRFFFDIFFFLFITIMLFQIIFGIIVDSYDEFQQEARDRENDQNNVCFACGFKREEIEKYNLRFDKHVRFHKIWKYFYYYQYLERSAVNDYNGTDIYVKNLIDKRQLTWMPTKRTKIIDEKKDINKRGK